MSLLNEYKYQRACSLIPMVYILVIYTYYIQFNSKQIGSSNYYLLFTKNKSVRMRQRRRQETSETSRSGNNSREVVDGRAGGGRMPEVGKWYYVRQISKYTLMFILSYVVLPLLVVAFIATRLLQLLTHGKLYDKITHLKLIIHAWLAVYFTLFIAGLWLISTLGSPSLILFCDQFLPVCSLTTWIRIFSYLYVMFILSFVSLVGIIKWTTVSTKIDYIETDLTIPESAHDLCDCVLALILIKFLFPEGTVFSNHKTFGLSTWCWLQTSAYVVLAFNVLIVATRLIVWLLRNFVRELPNDTFPPWYLTLIDFLLPIRLLVYWANGLKHSISFLLSSLLLFLTWVFYFGTRLDHTSAQAQRFFQFGYCTSLTLLIAACLRLIKTCIILSWKARSVYNRLGSKILQGAPQLFFLGLIGRQEYDIFNLLYDQTYVASHLAQLTKLYAFHQSNSDPVDQWTEGKRLSCTRLKGLREYLLPQQSRITTTYVLQQAALHFLIAKDNLLDDKYIPQILHRLQSCSEYQSQSIKDILQQLIGETDWDTFEKQLRNECGGSSQHSQDISFERLLEAWMEKARNNCLFLANTLSTAKEVVDCLNQIMSCLFIIGTFIMWLLFTELATPQVLVLISTPVLALTFIFQNTCKTLFEGIIFVYVVHPFNVGDLCVLEEEMMEVRAVGVWKTTFSKVGTQEELIYPNSELSQKSIINHKTDFDWNDRLELDVGVLTNENINSLMHEIEQYLDGGRDKFTPGYNRVKVLKTGDKIKMVVNFRHSNVLKNGSYFECLKKKDRLRSNYILYLQNAFTERMKT